MEEGALGNVLNTDPNNDNGYALEWRTAALAQNEVWTITAYERFTVAAFDTVFVVAPPLTEIEQGASGDLIYTLTNDDATGVNVDLSVSKDQPTWTATLQGPATVNVPANSDITVTVRVDVPAGADIGDTGVITLTADSSGGPLNSSDAARVLVTEGAPPPPQYTLTIEKAGDGDGTVIPHEGDHTYDEGAIVDLIAEPYGDSIFDGWSGHTDCEDGSVTMSSDKTCIATFYWIEPPPPPPPPPPPQYTLTIVKAGDGDGDVTPAEGDHTYEEGTVVALSATPAGDSTFDGWSGAADCEDGSVTMNADKTCTAPFTLGVPIDPSGGALTSTNPLSGTGIIIEVPAGAVTETLTLVYIELDDAATTPPTPTMRHTGYVFSLNLYRDGVLVTNPVFNPPLTVTLIYTDRHIAGLNHDSLEIYYWSAAEQQWKNDGIVAIDHQRGARRLIITLAHLTDFAIFAAPCNPDPWHVFLGKNEGGDLVKDMLTDDACNVYVMGESQETWGTPVLPPAAEEGAAIFVAKLDETREVVWNTFLGGAMHFGNSLALDDANGYLYLVGAKHGQTMENYSARLDAATGALDWERHSITETTTCGSFNGVTTERAGDVYVQAAGCTTNPEDPDAPLGSAIYKLNAAGTILWETFYPGRIESPQRCALDHSETRLTCTDFHTATWKSLAPTQTQDPIRAFTVYTDTGDCLVAQFAAADGRLEWYTYLGGAGEDRCAATTIAVDAAGHLYISGNSDAAWGDAPVQPFSEATSKNGWVAKLEPNGALVWHTFVGEDLYGTALAGDGAPPNGALYAIGMDSRTWGAPERSYSGGVDVLGVRLNPETGYRTGNTYLGGAGDDTAMALALDSSHKVLLSGISPCERDPAWPKGDTVIHAWVATWDATADFDGACPFFPIIDVEFTKTAEDVNGPPLLSNDLVRYTIRLTNTGTLTLTNAIITDTLPGEPIFVAAAPDDYSGSPPDDPLVWTAGDIAPGAGWSAVITVSVVGYISPLGDNTAALSWHCVEVIGIEDCTRQVQANVADPEIAGFALTMAITGTGSGVISPTVGAHGYVSGTVVTLSATAAPTSTFIGWSGDDDCEDDVVTIDFDRTCVATFERHYTLTVATAGAGSGVVSPTAGAHVYLTGTLVTLSATPAPTSTFDGWSGDAGCAEDVVTLDADKTCTATFTPIPTRALTIVVTGTGSGVVSPTVGAHTYLSGTHVPLTATATPPATFSGWSGDAGCAEGLVTLDTDKTCIATFDQYYTLTVAITGTGSGVISPTVGAHQFISGTEITLQASPVPGSAFTGWSGAADCADDVVTMDADKACTATFTLIPVYTLTIVITGTGSGSVNPAAGVHAYLEGATVTLRAYTDAGSAFDGWSGAADCAEGMVTMDADKTCIATFSRYYAFTFASDHVERSAAPAVVVYTHTLANTGRQTDTYTLTVHSSQGWPVTLDPAMPITLPGGQNLPVIASVSVPAGVLSGTVDTLVITATSGADPTLTARVTNTTTIFTPEYPLTLFSVGEGSVTATPSQTTYLRDSVVTLAAVPLPGWTFAGWSGALTGDVTPITITLDAPKSVTATFTAIAYTLDVSRVGQGEVTVTPAQASYAYGQIVTLTAAPHSDWTFFGWGGAVTGAQNPVTLTIDADMRVVATFAYALVEVTPDEGGSMTHTGADGAPIVTLDVPAGAVTETTRLAYIPLDADALPGDPPQTGRFVGRAFNLQVDPDVALSEGFAFLEPISVTLYYTDTEVAGLDITTLSLQKWQDDAWQDALCAGCTYGRYPEAHKLVAPVRQLYPFGMFAAPLHTLTVNVTPPHSGAVLRNPDQETYTHGMTVTLTPAPAPGWAFAYWSGDAPAEQTSWMPILITMDADKVITATFEAIPYTLDVQTSGAGAVTVTPSQTTYIYGDVVTLTATPDTDWHFAGWSGDIGNADNPYVFTIQGSMNVTATFSQEAPVIYTLQAQADGPGRVTLAPAGTKFISGTTVVLTAEPDPEHYFAGWSGDIGSADNPYTLTLQNDMGVTATFTAEPLDIYTLQVHTVGQGQVTHAPAGTTFISGATVRLAAEPAEGWAFTGWQGALDGDANPVTITMDAHKTITATFTPILTYTLTITTVGEGEVSIDPQRDFYDAGTVVTLTALPQAGWTFTGWSGDLDGDASPVAITMTGHKTITATFTVRSEPSYIFLPLVLRNTGAQSNGMP